MAKAKKLKSGNWRALVYSNTSSDGRRHYESFTAPTKKEAEFLAAEFALTKKEKAKGDISVSGAIEKYIESRRSVLSASTISGYEKIQRNYFLNLQHLNIKKVTAEKVQAEIDTMIKRLSPKTIRDAFALLSSSIQNYNIDLSAVILPKQIKHVDSGMPMPGEIIAAVSGTDVELPVMLGLWLGLRMSEIRGIKHKDILNDTLTISRSVLTVDGKTIEQERNKTYNSTRVLKLPEYISRLIPDGDPEDYLISMTGQMIYKHFSKALEKNSVPHIRFHDLRHLNASVMVALGVPDKYAMERGGWSTPKVLQSTYQHTFDELRASVDRTIDMYFDEICNTKCNTKN